MYLLFLGRMATGRDEEVKFEGRENDFLTSINSEFLYKVSTKIRSLCSLLNLAANVGSVFQASGGISKSLTLISNSGKTGAAEQTSFSRQARTSRREE